MVSKFMLRLYRNSVYANGFFPLFLFSLYSVKNRVEAKFLEAILVSSGINASQLSIFDKLFLYRGDLIICGIALPLIAIIFYTVFSKRIASYILFFVSFFGLILLYFNLQSWGQVGRFLTWSAAVDAWAFGLSQPQQILNYLAIDGLVKLLVLLVFSAVCFFGILHLKKYRFVMRGLYTLAIMYMLTSVICVGFSYASNIKPSPITNSFLLNSIRYIVAESNDKGVPDLSESELVVKFKELHKIEDYHLEVLSNFGAEKNSNLILFILETGSIDFLDVRNELKHKVWKRLNESLYIGSNHYSVFPASAESNLAILTGMYPPRAYYDTCLINLPSEGSIETYIDLLSRSGLKTAIYAPYKSQVPMDKIVFEHTGFQKVFYSQTAIERENGDKDVIALRELQRDISEWVKLDKRFAVGFYPQRGHGPWGGAAGESIKERGARVVDEQLDWLAQIVDQLEDEGILRKTVIVVTGDHGVRTREEDSSVRVGMIDKYSLHVPLLIFSPNSNYMKGISTKLTSHVDIASELTKLFGFSKIKMQQGLPLNDEFGFERNQYFMANWYYGADGYMNSDAAYMYSYILDVAYKKSVGELRFDSADVVSDSYQKNLVRDQINKTLDVQKVWVERYGCKKNDFDVRAFSQ